MRVFCDTSVIVPALVDQLPNHEAALLALSTYASEPHEAVCSTHSIAECYAVLSALPLPRRITPSDAEQIVAHSVAGRLTVYQLTQQDYRDAVALTARRGLAGGAIYDALHAVAAAKSHSERILTYNVRHFRRLAPDEITVATP